MTAAWQRRSGSQRAAFFPNNIVVQGSVNLLDCDNPDYSTMSYNITAPSLPFDITCGATTFTVRSQAKVVLTGSTCPFDRVHVLSDQSCPPLPPIAVFRNMTVPAHVPGAVH